MAKGGVDMLLGKNTRKSVQTSLQSSVSSVQSSVSGVQTSVTGMFSTCVFFLTTTYLLCAMQACSSHL